MTEDEARAIVRRHWVAAYGRRATELVILDQHTLERPYGWVFHYNRKKWVETGSPKDSMLGNGPILVLKHDGSIVQFGPHASTEYYLEQYERGLQCRHSGLCPACGYDLRATPERCPECGRETRSGGEVAEE